MCPATEDKQDCDRDSTTAPTGDTGRLALGARVTGVGRHTSHSPLSHTEVEAEAAGGGSWVGEHPGGGGSKLGVNAVWPFAVRRGITLGCSPQGVHLPRSPREWAQVWLEALQPNCGQSVSPQPPPLCSGLSPTPGASSRRLRSNLTLRFGLHLPGPG